MIIAKSKTFPKGVKVMNVVNRENWITDVWWLMFLGSGYVPRVVIVREQDEQDAIDTLTDSSLGWELTEDVEPCEHCQKAQDIYQANVEMGQEVPDLSEYYNQCECSFGGNYGVRIDIERVSYMEKCVVKFFAKKEDYPHVH